MRRLTGLLVVALALAQDWDPDNPSPPAMDDLSRKTMEAWKLKEYHLGRAGVRRALVTMEVKVPARPQRGDLPETARCLLYWDGKSISMDWDTPAVGDSLEFHGISLSYFSNWFDVAWWAVIPFRRARLAGKRTDDGGVAIDVTGYEQYPDDVYTLVFRPGGVLDRMDIRHPTEKGMVTGTRSYRYEEREGMYVLKGHDAASGAFAEKSEIVSGTVAGHVVPMSMKLTFTAKDANEQVWEFRFTDWKFDDDTAMPPEMDDGARNLMEAWLAKEHHLGRGGVLRATCAVEVKLPADDKGPRATKGAFRWDGKKASTKWEDEELAPEIDHGDLSVRAWCATWFEPWWKPFCFQGTKLRGVPSGDGGGMVVFGRDDDAYALTFDKDGVLSTAVWGTEERKAVETLKYELRDGKQVLRSASTLSTADPTGLTKLCSDYEYETVAGRLVPKSIRFTKTVGRARREEVSEIRFTDWKFNDDVK